MFLKKIRDKFLSPVIARLIQIQNLQAQIQDRQDQMETRIDLVQKAIGRIEFRQLENQDCHSINDREYQVFSQWGEDGIIQFLIDNISLNNKTFVEFGVETYKQSNTRFLLVNNNWAGLVIDGSDENISIIKNDYTYYNYNLKAISAFITTDNINSLLVDNGFSGEIGILSIDLDGNDYWIWDAINVAKPTIVIIEYNYRFGIDIAVTIPYQEDFDRSKSHHSMIYFGASLKALCLLAERKGYDFVGCCSNGVNAFFIRKDKKPDTILDLTPEEGYKLGQFCETRNRDGIQIKTSPEDEVLILQSLNLPVIKIK